MTLLLSARDIGQALDLRGCLDVLDAGFRSAPPSIRPQRVRTDLPGPGTATTLIPGLIEGIPAYSVKVNAKFPGARPALRGVVCLHDLSTGALLALLDSASVTAWRTGLAAAIGTHTLARADARDIAVIGAGTQSEFILRGLATLRPLGTVWVHDLDRVRAATWAARQDSVAAGGCVVADSVSSAVRRAEIVICATWSRKPLLEAGDLVDGQHVTSVGADEPGKLELGRTALERGRVFVDDLALSIQMGALGNSGLSADTAAGTLAEVLTGAIAGRRSAREVTIYAPIGLPWQDLAVSWLCYRHAIESGNRIGIGFDFLADEL
ncbi:ornithine cyclodeaminase family protein [Kribbella capetownensis]|uniref:Ornithine cyclodeaminase family protein n=1 Tax=Kribbella capetownensis TaxID=1572659 RepID=A0A4R0JSQ2_9ACTN|nr:ornithine cyclodeaminase family protein [Kribbella capetownensis]TCC49124.1 ornithine cyclodeaminase family protein [Kribbella capetownensis]